MMQIFGDARCRIYINSSWVYDNILIVPNQAKPNQTKCTDKNQAYFKHVITCF